MNYTQLVDNLTQSTVDKLATAIEIGRWENGEKLSEKQLESAIQAVMIWQAKHTVNADNEPFVVNDKGELYTGKGESHKAYRKSKDDPLQLITKFKTNH